MEGLYATRHRGMHLPADGLELETVELLVGHDERERGVRRARHAPRHRTCRLAAEYLPSAVDDAPVCVHDHEREDLRGSGLAIRAALPGELRTGAVARRRRS